MSVVCPYCFGSGEIEETSPVALSPMQFRIFDIVRRSAQGITTSNLIDRVYASDADGGPLNAYRSVRVQIFRANRRLAKANLRITTTTHGRDGHLFLQQLSSR